MAHHAAQPYGPTGGAWPVFEPERSDWLAPFFAVNAAFFMGLFFMISGYFLPGALDRKGPGRVLRERLLRLGVPLALVGLGIFALIGYGDAGPERSFLDYYLTSYLGEWRVEFAHLWFVFHLLAYSAAVILLSAFWPGLATTEGRSPAPGHGTILIALVGLIAVTILVRQAYPIDRWVRLFWVMPAEPAHLPQYLLLFAAGVVAGRNRWFERLPARLGLTWLGIGLAFALGAYAAIYSATFGGFDLFSSLPFGRVTAWAIWEAPIALGLSIGLVVAVRELAAGPGRLLPVLAGASYGVYVIHVFLLVPIQSALLGVGLPPFAKFALVTLAGIILSFAVAVGLKRLPGLRRVL